MSSAEPAVSTPGDNESDTSEQGRSEPSSSSQDTSPTNETSLEEEDAPVEHELYKDKKYRYIKWINETDQKCFSGRYKKKRNELVGAVLSII